MSRNAYQLINPVIEGTFNDVINSDSEMEAAKKMWERFTEHVSEHVPKFMFTLRNVESHGLSHFEVKEKLSDGSYSIRQIGGLSISDDDIDNFLSRVDSVKDSESNSQSQHGGRKRYKKYNADGRHPYPKESSDSSDSSDSEDSDDSDVNIYSAVEFRARNTTPIAMFHYTTKFYEQDNGLVFEHQSTKNPQVTLIQPKPVVTVPVVPVLTTKHTFTSIPVFKPPLLPRILLWC